MTLHSEENKKKEVYSEPLLIKYGALLDITAMSSGSISNSWLDRWQRSYGDFDFSLIPPSARYNINSTDNITLATNLLENGTPVSVTYTRDRENSFLQVRLQGSSDGIFGEVNIRW